MQQACPAVDSVRSCGRVDWTDKHDAIGLSSSAPTLTTAMVAFARTFWNFVYNQVMSNFRDTMRWKRLRARVRRRDPLCVECLSRGDTAVTEEVDHVVPVSGGGAVWSLENLQGLCRQCHIQKTTAENRQRHGWRGCGVDGRALPLGVL